MNGNWSGLHGGLITIKVAAAIWLMLLLQKSKIVSDVAKLATCIKEEDGDEEERMATSSLIELKVPVVQGRRGVKDCRVFAIAFTMPQKETT